MFAWSLVIPVSLRKVDVKTPETLVRSMAIQVNINYKTVRVRHIIFGAQRGGFSGIPKRVGERGSRPCGPRAPLRSWSS